MKNQLIISMFLLMMFCYSCKSKTKAVDTDNDKVCISDSLSKLVRIDTVKLLPINDEVKLSGEVSFDDNRVVKLFPFSSGQVEKVFVSLGDKVRKGQALAIIRSADVAGNYSDLSVAGKDISIAKKQLDNTTSLFNNGIASEREYTEAKENYNKALVAEEKIKDLIRINGGGRTSASGTYVMTAPMSGYVVEKNAEPGSFIRGDNTQNLFTVGDISQVLIWANVYETDIARVKEGYIADVTTLAWPGKIFTGIIDKSNQILDPETKVMKVRITLKNESLELKPEMFANVIVRNKEEKQTPSIPASAIITDNGKNFVVLYHDKCSLELRQIQILKSVNGISYINSGLAAGDKIISQNQILLYRALTED